MNLSTRVKKPDIDGHERLTSVMQYIRDTRKLSLTIEPDEHLKCWVDSSYKVYPDMRSHTGMTNRKRVTDNVSGKRKLNTKCSTEAQLIPVDDVMGRVLWTRHLLVAQEQHLPATTIYQDNEYHFWKNFELN